MRIVVLSAAAALAAIVAVPAAAGDYPGGNGYGASYGGQSGWDVAPVPLNVPDGQDAPDQGAWQGHDHYAGAYHQPVQRGYARLQRGYAMPRFWMSPDYQVTNWGFYGLSQPPRGAHWVRYYDEAVLVDDGGRIMQMVDDLDWDQPMAARGEREERAVYDQKYGGMAPGSYYAPPSTEVIAPPPVRMVPPPPVAWSAAPPPVTWSAPGTTVVVQSPTVVTTTTATTTTYVEEVAARPRPVVHRAWHRPVRRVVTCCCLCTR